MDEICSEIRRKQYKLVYLTPEKLVASKAILDELYS